MLGSLGWSSILWAGTCSAWSSCTVQLGFLHCMSVQFGSLGSLSQLGNVGQIGFLHCTSVQLGFLVTLFQLGTVHHDWAFPGKYVTQKVFMNAYLVYF
jgi:hypothetical protein